MTDTRRHALYSNIIPASISGCFTFLISVTDGIIIGRGVSTAALGGVNIAVPFIFMYYALFAVVCAGGGTVAAVSAGKNDSDEAQNVFMHSLLLSILVGIGAAVIGSLFSEQISRLLGADQMYIGYASTYIYWLSAYVLFEAVSTCIQTFLRIDGYQKLITAIHIFGSVLNIVLDIVMVFVYHRGVFGAAFATGVAQLLKCVLFLALFLRKKGGFRFTRFSIKPKLLWEILYRGTPEALLEFGTVFTVASFNQVLLKHVGPIGVDAFAIVSYIASLATEMFFGVTVGLQPLLSVSYGKQDRDDIRYYTKGSIQYAVLLGAALMALCFALRRPLCVLFSAEGETLSYSVRHLWKFCAGMPFTGVASILSVYLYSTERTKQSIVYNVLRSFVVNVLVIRLFPLLFASDYIFFAYPAYQAVLIVIGLGITAIDKDSQRMKSRTDDR